ncbi:MAG: hypothetical protein DRN15_07245 [Thermoprotei archaeon]|nr:MAG: hypothetical protein DRN15_07245 [Thermoprotei archaeon]
MYKPSPKKGRRRWVSYRRILPPGLVHKVKSQVPSAHRQLVQLLITCVKDADTKESYLARVNRMMDSSSVSDEEREVLREIAHFIAGNLSFVKECLRGHESTRRISPI